MGLKEPTDQFEQARKMLSEASSLIKEDTIDSLLRYFQTGLLNENIHLPSVLLGQDAAIQKKLAKKLEPMLQELDFQWNETLLKEEGKMVMEYIEAGYRLEFATLLPSQRILKFNFDFVEMERENQIKIEKIQRKITETKDRYIDSKKYIAENTGIKRFKNIKTIERLEENIKNISKDIKLLQTEIEEIHKQRGLLRIIQSKLEETKYKFRRYGIVLEFAKNQEYDI